MNKLFTTRLSTSDAAELLGVTPARVRQLIKDGFISRGPDGRVTLVNAVQGHHRAITEKRSQRAAADAKLKELRGKDIEMRMAERDHRLIALDEAIDVMRDNDAEFRADLDGLAAAVTRDLPLRNKIQEHLSRAYARRAARFEQKAAALEETGAASDQRGA